MNNFTSQMLKQIAPHIPSAKREELFPVLVKELRAAEINTYLRISAFLGQILEESGEFSRWEENLSYSAQRLCQVWPGRFPTLSSTQGYAHNPVALAEKVYGGRMGNTSPGDGYKYRGRGPEQTTGKSMYLEAQNLTGLPLVDNPDLLLQPEVGFKVAAASWKAHGLNQLADDRKFKEITIRINGGLNGYAERLEYYSRCLRYLPEDLSIDAGQSSPPQDKLVSDVHGESVKPDVLIPTDMGVKIPAVTTNPENKDEIVGHLQSVVTGHSESFKSIVARAALKIGSFITAIWVSGVAGKLFLLAITIIIVFTAAYEINKHWPRVKAFFQRILPSWI